MRSCFLAVLWAGVPRWDALLNGFWFHIMLILREVEQVGQWASVWQASVLISQLVEIRVEQGWERSRPGLWIVLQQSSDEVNGFTWSPVSEDLLPWQWSDLWEAVLFVFGVHCLDLLSGRCAQDLDDLDELVNAALSREDWLAEHELSDDAADGPDVDGCGVVRVPEN